MSEHNLFRKIPIQETILLLFILILGLIFVRFTWKRIENEQIENILLIARSIEATMPDESLKTLEAKPEDVRKQQYMVIKKTLRAIIRINTTARFAYIYTLQNGKLLIMADSEPEDSKDYSPPGQEYTEADIVYFKPFSDGKELVTAPVSDRWGMWRSVFIPIKDEATGKTIAVFGMDFSAKSWNNFLLFNVIESSVLITILFLSFILLYVIKVKNKSLKIKIEEHKQVEENLLKSENQKAAILRAIPDLLFIFNQNGDYMEVYTEDDSKLFMPREALIGKNIRDLLPPDIAANAISAFNQSLLSKELVQFFYSIRINGKTEFYEARIVPASENTALTIVRDITERKVAEEALLKSQKRSREQRNAIARIAVDEVISSCNTTVSFQRLTEEMSVAIQVERASIWLLSDNKTELRCISLFENTTKSHSSGVVLFYDDYPRYFDAINHESRISASDAQNDNRTNEFTYGYLIPLGIKSMLDAGIYFEGELQGVVCFEHIAEKRNWYSDEESFASTIASIVAQTLANNKRKLSEDALRISEDKYRTMIEFSNDLIWTLDNNGNFTFLNEIASKTTGLNAKEWIGKSFVPLILSEDLQMILGIFQQNMNGIACSYELRFKKSDESILIISVNTSPIYISGKIEGVVSFGRDITESKLAQETIKQALIKAESGDRLKTAFMNNISHEIRTPLNGILGICNLLIQPDITNDEKMQYYSHLETSTNRLLDTITNYMDISLIASGNIEVCQNSISPSLMFYQLYEQYQLISDKKNIGLKLEIQANSEHITLLSDVVLFNKLMGHLIDNAVKFTNKGDIILGYTIKHGVIEFFVRDTGVGIREESLSLIFESFKQEELSRNRGFEGSGLGLSIAQGLVRLLGGEMHVVSVKGEGSTFYFTIPYNEIPIGANSEEKDGKPPIIENPVVLIADDDDTNLFYLEVILKKKCVSTITARDGKQAVDQCREHPEISLVLMDIKMPVMDGIQATNEIKSFRKDLPIIAFTAFAMSGDTKMARDAGCDDYLPKPVSKEKLIGKLQKYGVVET